MNNRKSNEKFLAELKNIKPNIKVLDDYISRDADMRCMCILCSNEWISTPRKLLKLTSGTGCSNCSKYIRKSYKKRSKEQLQEELNESQSNILLLGDYLGMTHKIESKCLICGEIWYPRPDHLIEGHGCPKCGGAKQKNNKEFLLQLGKINQFINVLEDYKNAKTKLLCKCKYCGYEWRAIPSKLLAGNGCPKCDSRNKTSFSEQAILYYIRKVYSNALGRYKLENSNLEFDVYIPEEKIAIEYDGVYWHKDKNNLEYEKYLLCKKNNIKLIRIREGKTVTEVADYIIFRNLPFEYNTLDESIEALINYLNCKQISINTERDAYDIREQYYSDLKDNSLGVKYPVLAEEWLQEKNGGITPFMISYGCNDRYWWKCSACGYEWRTAVCDRSCSGKGCKKCSDRRNSENKTKSQFLFEEEIKKINSNICVVGLYRGTHKLISVSCNNCGNQWNTYPTTLLRGRQCPKCCSNVKTNKKKTHQEFIDEMAKLQPNLVFLEEYQGRSIKLRVRCTVCNQEFAPKPADLLHGHYKKHLHIDK